ncbi:hypothetical protein [Tautonia rosea]|uniref:hypothetical protein n=1 Tax=Tautonia rosea TaxID=2728037 RepID=UPI00147330BF|nr:hypothetical protein [Tautonia rosea]
MSPSTIRLAENDPRRRFRGIVGVLFAIALSGSGVLRAQDDGSLIVRPGPPALDDFETDTDGDGTPDGWYNLRDAILIPEGGVVGPTVLRFEADQPSRPARISRGFGVDGRQTEALILGLWVRRIGDRLVPGERIGEEPALLIDLLDENLRSTSRGLLGPWDTLPEGRWVRWVTRVPVPSATRDAIMTVGLLGGTGTLEIDGLTIAQEPVGGQSTTNVIVNNGFELGGLTPDHWIVEGNARRVHSGDRSDAAIELSTTGDLALAPIGLPVRGLDRLAISVKARGTGLRGAGGAQAVVFFLGDDGRPLPGAASGARAVRWSGSFPWRVDRSVISVPAAASRAVLQLEKVDRQGTLWVDEVEVLGEGGLGGARTWAPYHVDGGGDSWPPYPVAEAIEPGSALDFSGELETPAGTHGFVTAEGGRLRFENGTPARFFGVSLMPPLPFTSTDQIEAIADRLARSGVNLVNLCDLDAPFGPGGSLVDDAANNTRSLDPLALADFDRAISAFKTRGIYVAITLQSQARFRSDDEIADGRALPPGGGPAAAFDPQIRERTRQLAEALLTRINPETGLALRDDPVLAWVTLAGELSLFNLIEDPDALPPSQADALRERSRTDRRAGRPFWQVTEAAQWSGLAADLRSLGLRVPIAGSAHFRREPEFAAAQRAEGLDLIDDRLFWQPPRFAAPELRSFIRRPSDELSPLANAKVARDRAYVVGQYASYTEGAWALPFEGPDLLLVSALARSAGWDALVRRAISRLPDPWGAAASGTGGGQDVFVLPEIVNGNPQVFGLFPHASALLLRKNPDADSSGLPGTWDRRIGRFTIDAPDTIGVAGVLQGAAASRDGLSIRSEDAVGAVVVSTVSGKPIAEADRFLITTVARVQPTALQWVDHWKREVADPGRPPLRVEPIRASITWNRDAPASVFALDNAGRRVAEIKGVSSSNGLRFVLDRRDGYLHWELAVGSP